MIEIMENYPSPTPSAPPPVYQDQQYPPSYPQPAPTHYYPTQQQLSPSYSQPPPSHYPPQQQWPLYSQPPPAHYPPQQVPPPAQQTAARVTVVQTQPTAVTGTVFRTYPVTVTDSNGQQVQTILSYRTGVLVWIAACAIFWITIGFGLCFLALLPFCVNDLKDVYHISPTDGKVVGVYRRM